MNVTELGGGGLGTEKAVGAKVESGDNRAAATTDD